MDVYRYRTRIDAAGPVGRLDTLHSLTHSLNQSIRQQRRQRRRIQYTLRSPTMVRSLLIGVAALSLLYTCSRTPQDCGTAAATVVAAESIGSDDIAKVGVLIDDG